MIGGSMEESPMAMVVDQEPLRDANCLVVWRHTMGQPAYGSYYSYQCTAHAEAGLVAEAEWHAAIDAAVALAERNGIPTVYVVRH
jgi:hypothetical protein